jgi:hypothetical protein
MSISRLALNPLADLKLAGREIHSDLLRISASDLEQLFVSQVRLLLARQDHIGLSVI